MLKYRTIRMIKQKASEGLTAYQIGKDLGISKNTAARYMAEDAPAPCPCDQHPRAVIPPERPSQCRRDESGAQVVGDFGHF